MLFSLSFCVDLVSQYSLLVYFQGLFIEPFSYVSFAFSLANSRFHSRFSVMKSNGDSAESCCTTNYNVEGIRYPNSASNSTCTWAARIWCRLLAFRVLALTAEFSIIFVAYIYDPICNVDSRWFLGWNLLHRPSFVLSKPISTIWFVLRWFSVGICLVTYHGWVEGQQFVLLWWNVVGGTGNHFHIWLVRSWNHTFLLTSSQFDFNSLHSICYDIMDRYR